MLEHFKDYRRIVGDHPQNLAATSLALNAFMVTGERKYRDWLLEYVDAWRRRTLDNGGIIPTNGGLEHDLVTSHLKPRGGRSTRPEGGPWNLPGRTRP